MHLGYTLTNFSIHGKSEILVFPYAVQLILLSYSWFDNCQFFFLGTNLFPKLEWSNFDPKPKCKQLEPNRTNSLTKPSQLGPPNWSDWLTGLVKPQLAAINHQGRIFLIRKASWHDCNIWSVVFWVHLRWLGKHWLSCQTSSSKLQRDFIIR